MAKKPKGQEGPFKDVEMPKGEHLWEGIEQKYETDVLPALEEAEAWREESRNLARTTWVR